ncbi:hypothetical protein [Microbulbifer sp. GL-2]|uniref:hypothetical protein n=1 Tax=Microbulbifer sp. GL-2 TaxID=2591606 RepID=UPI00116281E7|nr:hypothetical protein [Microbulbifer sp. GL-2]BBM02037.1 hypothetical protein GL2_21110 [Microbulbifer sp. GL-2]
MLTKISLIFMAMMGAGCGAQQTSLELLQPALLADSEPQSRSEVQRVVSEAMGGIEIHLSPNVFLENSLLVFDKTPRQMRLIGRDMGRPIKFKLFWEGDRCWLARLPDGPRWALEAKCVPAGQD